MRVLETGGTLRHNEKEFPVNIFQTVLSRSGIMTMFFVTMFFVPKATAALLFQNDDLIFGYDTFADKGVTTVTGSLATDIGTLDYVSVGYNANFVYDPVTKTGHYSTTEGKVSINFYATRNAPASVASTVGNSLHVKLGLIDVTEKASIGGFADASSTPTSPDFWSMADGTFAGKFTVVGESSGDFHYATGFAGDDLTQAWIRVPVKWNAGVSMSASIQSVAVPEPSLALLAPFGLLLRRRR
jgi:hypothetical protein